MQTPTVEKLIIEPAAPFDFQKSLDFIKGFPATKNEQLVKAGTLRKGVRLNRRTLAFELHSSGSVDAPRLELTVHANGLITDNILQTVEQRVRFFLSLDDDLSEFIRLAESDAAFAERVLPKFYGYRHVKFPSPFENAMWAILAQRQTMHQSRQMKQRLVEQHSEAIRVGDTLFTAFPVVEDFLPVSHEALAECIGHERKALYLTNVISAFANVSDDFLVHAPYQDVKDWLLNIKGIGEWSALFVLGRGLGRMEQALTSDPNSRFNQSMLQAAQTVYGPISLTDLQARAQYYGAWQGYWAHFLKANSEIH